MRFTQFRGAFHCSLQNFNYFCLRNFPSFRGYYMYLLTQLSIFDAVKNPKRFEKPLMYSTRQKCQCKKRTQTTPQKKTGLKKKIINLRSHQSRSKHFLTAFSEKTSRVSFLILQNFSR